MHTLSNMFHPINLQAKISCAGQAVIRNNSNYFSVIIKERSFAL